MAAQGSYNIQGQNGSPVLLIEWDEYRNEIIVHRRRQEVSLSYEDAREVYKFLFFLFGRVAMPEIH